MTQIGYYGKTVHRGDFVRFNLPQIFVSVMDDWLQTTISKGESTYNDEWEQIYSACSGFQFHLSPNIAGNNAWIGVLMPSADKVGRRFPMCIAASLNDAHAPSWTSQNVQNIVNMIATLCFDSIQPEFKFEKLQEQITTLSKLVADTLEEQQGIDLEVGDTSNPEQFKLVSKGQHLESASGSIADIVLRQAYFNYSVWRPLPNSSKSTSLLTSGMPDATSALALFSNTLINNTTLSIPPDNDEYEQLGDFSIEESLTDLNPDQQRFNSKEVLPRHELNYNDTAIGGSNSRLDAHVPEASEHEVSVLQTHASGKPVRPQIEPLELDDEESTETPWD